jgi:hypothetical protein
MALGLAPGQFPVGLKNVLNGFPQGNLSLVDRPLLNVAARELLCVSDPPLPNLLEDAGIPILHTPIVPPPAIRATGHYEATQRDVVRTTKLVADEG